MKTNVFLGPFRFLLAIMVVVSHLAGLFGNVAYVVHLGVFAVFGFYVVSGFLITHVLNETYGFKFLQFSINRFLRLFPIYYAVLAVSAVFIYYLPQSAGSYHASWAVTPGWKDALGNATIVFFEFYTPSFRIIPPAWSVSVELINYFFIWLIVGRNRKLTLICLALSISYHLVSLSNGQDWIRRYGPSYAALLPFSLGACFYHYRNSISKIKPAYCYALLILFSTGWVINLILCGIYSGLSKTNFDLFFYANFITISGMVAFITCYRKTIAYSRVSRLLGDLAYPVFLTHWIEGFVVSVALGIESKTGFTLFLYSMPLVVLTSWSLVWVMDKIIEPVRDRIRSGHSSPGFFSREMSS